MGEQLASGAEALRMFFTDDIYLVAGEKSGTESLKPAVTEVKETVIPVVFKYLGKNQKNVLILVNDSLHDTSTERGRELLRNIVKALQLTASDFALLNYAAYENASFDALKAFFSSKLVLSFGVTPAQLGIADKPSNAIVMEAGVQLVFCQNLDLLAENLNEKKALWGSLKQIQL